MKIGCVLMAAGNGCRFGKNKLCAELFGSPVYEYALNVLSGVSLYKTVVVSQYDEILFAAKERGFLAVRNDRPDEGVSLTIRLGLSELADADACVFMVADQPRLTAASVQREIDMFCMDDTRAVALSCNGRRGNPVLFPKKYFSRLMELTGDRGGSAALKACGDEPALCEIEDETELFDIDDEAMLMVLKRLCNK